MNKYLRKLYWNEIEATIPQLTIDNAYDISAVKAEMKSKKEKLKAVVVEVLTKVNNHKRVAIPDDLLERIQEIQDQLPFLDFEDTVERQVDNYDDAHKPRNLKSRRAGEQLCLFNPQAHLIIDYKLRANMDGASRAQAQLAKDFGNKMYDEQREEIDAAQDEWNGYWDERFDVWVPRYSALGGLERNVFGYKDNP